MGMIQYLYTDPRLFFMILPVLVLAFTVHEYSHALVADKLGDNTARFSGRLTLDPREHVDPIGLFLLMVVGFGWAKPVPINPRNFRGDRKKGEIMVSIAGPLSNFIMAFIFGVLMMVLFKLNYLTEDFTTIIRYGMGINLVLMVFNLIPLPPLDGSKIFYGTILPNKWLYKIKQNQQMVQMIFLLVILMGRTGNGSILWMVLMPIINFFQSIIITVADIVTFFL